MNEEDLKYINEEYKQKEKDYNDFIIYLKEYNKNFEIIKNNFIKSYENFNNVLNEFDKELQNINI